MWLLIWKSLQDAAERNNRVENGDEFELILGKSTVRSQISECGVNSSYHLDSQYWLDPRRLSYRLDLRRSINEWNVFKMVIADSDDDGADRELSSQTTPGCASISQFRLVQIDMGGPSGLVVMAEDCRQADRRHRKNIFRSSVRLRPWTLFPFLCGNHQLIKMASRVVSFAN